MGYLRSSLNDKLLGEHHTLNQQYYWPHTSTRCIFLLKNQRNFCCHHPAFDKLSKSCILSSWISETQLDDTTFLIDTLFHRLTGAWPPCLYRPYKYCILLLILVFQHQFSTLPYNVSTVSHVSHVSTAQKMKFSIKDFFSKCDQICRKLRIWSHLLKKSLMKNFIFCTVSFAFQLVLVGIGQSRDWLEFRGDKTHILFLFSK